MNMTFWKTFWASLLASIVSGILILIIFFVVIGGMIASFGSLFEPEKLVIEEQSVLHMELNEMIGDYSKSDLDLNNFQIISQFGLKEILRGIEIAKEDDRIEGIFLNCDNVSAGMAVIKEIRDALADFQTAGKFVVSYHENYSKRAYYLASVANEVYVFPSGRLEFLGLGTEVMFLKGALEKLDVEMQIIRGSNNRFKSAVEPLIYDKMSEANREQTQRFLDALWGEMTSAIAASRNMKESYLNTIADSAFVRRSGDAVKYKMADGIKYYDEVLDLLSAKVDTAESYELKLVPFKKYVNKEVKDESLLAILDKKNIAVIFAEGEIVDGVGSPVQIGGTSLSQQIRAAREDEDIKGVVLRINSPGGSALASDIIWREVVLLKKEKPIVVSMGNVAASGGYYIACAADKIYAQPNTITGSIGVFGIIPYTGDMFKNKLGITFDRVQTNDHSNVMSMNKRLDEMERKLIQQGVDDIYDDFISKVADGRGMTKVEVDSIGQGRVWAGTDALAIGLIDGYGGLNDAIADVAERANIATDSIALDYYPKKSKDPLSEIMNGLAGANIEVPQRSSVELQIVDIYNYLQTVGRTQQIQARIPFLYWID